MEDVTRKPTDDRDGVVFRRVAAEDSLAELTDLLHRAYRPLAEQGFRYWSTHQSVEDTRTRIRRGECYVGVRRDRIVATITLVGPEAARGCPWYERPGVAVFSQFAVEPDLQGAGLGSRLLDRVESRASEMGALELALDTAEGAARLIRFYERRGYRFVEYADWEKTNYRSVVLSKPLGRALDRP
jgi:GNAT superfamily N-acetyltransferase